MRVAVYLPLDHPEHGGESEKPVAVAYRLGRIEPGVHNAPLGHPEIPFEEFVLGLVEQAKAEYPDAQVELERLVDKGDGTAEWIPSREFDPNLHTPQGAGNVRSGEFTATSEQQAGDN